MKTNEKLVKIVQHTLDNPTPELFFKLSNLFEKMGHSEIKYLELLESCNPTE